MFHTEFPFLDHEHLSSIFFFFLCDHTTFTHFLENPLWKLTGYKLTAFHRWENLKMPMEFKLLSIRSWLLAEPESPSLHLSLSVVYLPHITLFIYELIYLYSFLFSPIHLSPLHYLLHFPGFPSDTSAPHWIVPALALASICYCQCSGFPSLWQVGSDILLLF